MADTGAKAVGGDVSQTQLALGLGLIWFAYTLGTNVGLSILLERSGPSALARLMVFYALALVAVMGGVSFFGRGGPLRSLTISLLLAAGLVGIFGEGSKASWAAIGIFIVASLVGDICVALFWAFANELFDARAAKQIFPRVGAAGTAGAALAGIVARIFGDMLGERGLVALSMVSLVAGAAWAFRLEKRARTSVPRGSTQSRPSRAARSSMSSQPEDRSLIWGLAVGFLVSTAVTYVGRCLFSWSLADAYGADAVAIAKLNGLLSAISSVATMIVQLVVTPFLLARWGAGPTMLLYPASLLLTLGALIMHPGLTTGIAVFFATTVVCRAVQSPIESVLPTALSPRDASRTVLLLTAIGTPLGMLLSGVALMFGRAGQATTVVLIGLGMSALLAAVGRWPAAAYRGALRLRLSKGGSDLRQRLFDKMASTQEAQSMLEGDLTADDPVLVERLEALVRARSHREDVAPSPWRADGPLPKIALARIAEAYRLHAALERLSARFDQEAREEAAGASKGARELWFGSIRHRIEENLRAVILVLRVETGHRDLDRISRRIFDADPRTRAAALEILDVHCPDDLRSLLVPLVERSGMGAAAERASRRFGAPAKDPIEDLLDVPDSWLRACTAYALLPKDVGLYRPRLLALFGSTDPFLRVGVAHALEAAHGED